MNTINEPQQKASESLSSNDKIFDFPLLVDSSIKGGLITYNQDMKNTKEKISECDLELCDENGNKNKLIKERLNKIKLYYFQIYRKKQLLFLKIKYHRALILKIMLL